MKIAVIRIKKKHLAGVKALIPGASPKEIVMRALALGFEILQAKNAAASDQN